MTILITVINTLIRRLDDVTLLGCDIHIRHRFGVVVVVFGILDSILLLVVLLITVWSVILIEYDLLLIVCLSGFIWDTLVHVVVHGSLLFTSCKNFGEVILRHVILRERFNVVWILNSIGLSGIFAFLALCPQVTVVQRLGSVTWILVWLSLQECEEIFISWTAVHFVRSTHALFVALLGGLVAIDVFLASIRIASCFLVHHKWGMRSCMVLIVLLCLGIYTFA